MRCENFCVGLAPERVSDTFHGCKHIACMLKKYVPNRFFSEQQMKVWIFPQLLENF